MMVDATLGVAGCARGIKKRKRLPLIYRLACRKSFTTFCDKCFIVHLAETLAAFALGIIDIDDQQLTLRQGESLFDDLRKRPVGQ